MHGVGESLQNHIEWGMGRGENEQFLAIFFILYTTRIEMMIIAPSL